MAQVPPILERLYRATPDEKSETPPSTITEIAASMWAPTKVERSMIPLEMNKGTGSKILELTKMLQELVEFLEKKEEGISSVGAFLLNRARAIDQAPIAPIVDKPSKLALFETMKQIKEPVKAILETRAKIIKEGNSAWLDFAALKMFCQWFPLAQDYPQRITFLKKQFEDIKNEIKSFKELPFETSVDKATYDKFTRLQQKYDSLQEELGIRTLTDLKKNEVKKILDKLPDPFFDDLLFFSDQLMPDPFPKIDEATTVEINNTKEQGKALFEQLFNVYHETLPLAIAANIQLRHQFLLLRFTIDFQIPINALKVEAQNIQDSLTKALPVFYQGSLEDLKRFHQEKFKEFQICINKRNSLQVNVDKLNEKWEGLKKAFVGAIGSQQILNTMFTYSSDLVKTTLENLNQEILLRSDNFITDLNKSLVEVNTKLKSVSWTSVSYYSLDACEYQIQNPSWALTRPLSASFYEWNGGSAYLLWQSKSTILQYDYTFLECLNLTPSQSFADKKKPSLSVQAKHEKANDSETLLEEMQRFKRNITLCTPESAFFSLIKKIPADDLWKEIEFAFDAELVQDSTTLSVKARREIELSNMAINLYNLCTTLYYAVLSSVNLHDRFIQLPANLDRLAVIARAFQQSLTHLDEIHEFSNLEILKNGHATFTTIAFPEEMKDSPKELKSLLAPSKGNVALEFMGAQFKGSEFIPKMQEIIEKQRNKWLEKLKGHIQEKVVNLYPTFLEAKLSYFKLQYIFLSALESAQVSRDVVHLYQNCKTLSLLKAKKMETLELSVSIREGERNALRENCERTFRTCVSKFAQFQKRKLIEENAFRETCVKLLSEAEIYKMFLQNEKTFTEAKRKIESARDRLLSFKTDDIEKKLTSVAVTLDGLEVNSKTFSQLWNDRNS